MENLTQAFMAIVVVIVAIITLIIVNIERENELAKTCAPFVVEGHTSNVIVCTSLDGYVIKLKPVEKE
jgi:hypothetical protein